MNYKEIVIKTFAEKGKIVRPEDFVFTSKLTEIDSVGKNLFLKGDVDEFLLFLEKEKRVRYGGKIISPDINSTMVRILIDWLNEVHKEFDFNGTTFFLTVYILYAFLDLAKIGIKKLQLAGLACTMIAAKYEEVEVPLPDRYIYISDNSYSKKELLRMEKIVLRKLEYEFMVPTVKTFQYFFRDLLFEMNDMRKEDCSDIAKASSYLLRLSSLDVSFPSFLPSDLAIASLFVASRKIIGHHENFEIMWEDFYSELSSVYNYEPSENYEENLIFIMYAYSKRNDENYKNIGTDAFKEIAEKLNNIKNEIK